MSGKFLLLLGPSGVGKSSVIERLLERDGRFLYVSPFTTRELRPGETDKVHISDTDLESRRDEFLCVNELYGIKYATPKEAIRTTLRTGGFPVLDWPIERLEVMREAFPDGLFVVYLLPATSDLLRERLSRDRRDPEHRRLQKGLEEIGMFRERPEWQAACHLVVTVCCASAEEIAQQVYESYMAA